MVKSLKILTLAGGQVNGFSPKLRFTTLVMNRNSTGKETMRFPLKSNVVSCRYEISEIDQKFSHYEFIEYIEPLILDNAPI